MFRRLLIVALLAGGLVGCGGDEEAPTTDNDLIAELYAEYRVWIDELEADLATTPSDRLEFSVDGATTTVSASRCGAEFGELPPSESRVAVSGMSDDMLIQVTIVADDPAAPTAAMFELTLTDLASPDLTTIADYRSGNAVAALDDGLLTVTGGAIGLDDDGEPVDVVVRIATDCSAVS